MGSAMSLPAHPSWERWAPRWRDRVYLPHAWRWDVACSCLALALIAGAPRLALILRYPLLYDSDAYGRWLQRAHPFDSPPWLPVFQVCIYALTRVVDTILAVRLLSAFFGVTAVLACWLLFYRAFGPSIAYLAALLLAINPLFLLFSIVPYQEGLFLTLACLALWLACSAGRGVAWWFWLSLIVGLAALTRYEGWLLAGLLWGLFLWRRWRVGTLTWRFAAGSALALGWAPLLWLALNRNISPVGVQTLAPTLNPGDLLATLSTFWLDMRLSLGLAGTLLTLAALLWLGWRAMCGSELAVLLIAFLLGDLLLIAVLRPFSPDNLRLPLLSLPALLAGIAGLLVDVARLLSRLYRRHLANSSSWAARMLASSWVIVCLFALLTIALALRFVPLASAQVAGYATQVEPAYLAAKMLPASLPVNATVAVLGENTSAYALPVYAQQDGRRLRFAELELPPTSTPAPLAAALRAVSARALVAYGPALTSPAVAALARQGQIVSAGHGPGYALWLVQTPRL